MAIFTLPSFSSASQGDGNALRIPSSAGQTPVAYWIIAIGWNLMVAGFFFLFFDLTHLGDLVPLAILLGIGLGLLYWAKQENERLQSIPRPTLDLEFAPVPLGGRLQGRIVLLKTPDSPTPFHLALSCIEQYIQSGSTHYRTGFQAAQNATPSGDVLPVIFDIPIDALETRSDGEGHAVYWRLEVIATVGGELFLEKYEIPVAASVTALPPEQAERVIHSIVSHQQEVREYRLPPESGVSIYPTVHGKWEFLFTSRKATTLGFLLLYFSAGAACVIPILPGFLMSSVLIIGTVILLGSLVHEYFGITRVSVEPGLMEIRRELFGFDLSTITIPAAEVVEIKPLEGFRMIGPGLGRKPGPQILYRIMVYCRDDHAVAGSLIGDKLGAEYLATQMSMRLKGLSAA